MCEQEWQAAVEKGRRRGKGTKNVGGYVLCTAQADVGGWLPERHLAQEVCKNKNAKSTPFLTLMAWPASSSGSLNPQN